MQVTGIRKLAFSIPHSRPSWVQLFASGFYFSCNKCVIINKYISLIQLKCKIIHNIVQNNTYYSARSRWTKQQHKM
jgi:hypothetical protein